MRPCSGSRRGASAALRAIARLIEAHGIIVLTKPDWDAKKAELAKLREA